MLSGAGGDEIAAVAVPTNGLAPGLLAGGGGEQQQVLTVPELARYECGYGDGPLIGAPSGPPLWHQPWSAQSAFCTIAVLLFVACGPDVVPQDSVSEKQILHFSTVSSLLCTW